MDRRITIQTQNGTRGALGGMATGYTDLAKVWAEVRPLKGKELIQSQQMKSQVTLAVTIRYRADVHANQRIVLEDGRAAQIGWIEEVGRRQWLTLFCELIDG